MANIEPSYRASSNLTVTGLNAGLASSSTWVAGWSSGTIDNTTDLDLDKLISAKFTAESSGLTAGEIRVYVYTMLDDSTWPDLFSSGTEGTEGAATLHDTEIRDSLCLLWAQVTDTTASRVYQMIQTSIPNRMGLMFAPRKCALFIAHSMVAALETSGNQVTVWGDKGTA
jgi:hypothetical protein